MTPIAVTNATVVHRDRVGAGECVLVRDGLVEHTGARRVLAGYEVVDVAGGVVTPGLVDLHAHGARGRTFNEADPAAWAAVLAAHAAAGTTSLLATLATDTPAGLTRALATAGTHGEGSALLGTHLEGPYLNPEFRGAHPADALRTPSDGSWRDLAGGPDTPRLVTLAPELPGATDLIRALAARGVVVSAGHSAAAGDELAAAQRAGLRHVAHLWSGQSALRKHGPWRRPGLLEETLASTGLTAEVIADGVHVPAPLVRIAHRCLGPDRLCLVSDASAGTGLPAGTTFRMGAARGVVADGVAMSHDGASFCGSTSFLADVLRHAVAEAGIPLADAVRMATATPAAVLGMADRIGSLAPGRVADLVVFDGELRPRLVMRAGRWMDG